MVYRSGTTNQYAELTENDEINKNSSNLFDISDKVSTTASIVSTNTNEKPLETSSNCIINNLEQPKRKLRTSKRLNSLNTDLLALPKEKSATITNNSNSGAGSSNPNKSCSDGGYGSGGTPTKTDSRSSLGGRKLIKNRRYTITDCVHVNNVRDERNDTVPFVTHNKNGKSSSNTGISNKLNKNKSRDDSNILNGRLSCSVSLERLTGIIDTLVYQTKMSNEKDETIAANKIWCLYCDRTFLSQKLYAKHVERMHQGTSGRRLSARTTSNVSSSNYWGCSYCNIGKITCLPVEDLPLLVQHLVNVHPDKYFACKDCMLRFQSREIMQQHCAEQHTNDKKTSPKNVTGSKRKTKTVQSLPDNPPASATIPLEVQVDFDSNDTSDQSSFNEPTLRSRLRRTNDSNKTHLHSRKKPQMFPSEETFLSRLGITQNRSPRSRKGAKNRRGCSSELFQMECTRSTRSNKNSKSINNLANLIETTEFIPPKLLNSKIEPIASTFDEDFYQSVNFNVKQNLNCHLDGKLEPDVMSPIPFNSTENIPAIRSILVKSPLVNETEIHEATTISPFTAFPTLLTAQQYGAELQAGKMKKPITKNSWKWKWDCVKKYKYVNEGGKIVKKVKQSTTGMKDLAKLDMWTQLTMRTKHETITRQEVELSGDDSLRAIGEAAREEKRKLIEQLNKILDTRVLPQINLEQNDQTIIKLETRDDSKHYENALALPTNHFTVNISENMDFPASLNLFKRDRNAEELKMPIVLSGEWARPRCYICVGCGARFSTVRSLEEHKTSKHPFVHSTHYEIVGKELIDGDLFRNFYIPSLALQRHNEQNKKSFFSGLCGGDDSMDSITSYSMSISKSDSIDMDSNSRNSKVSMSSLVTSTSLPSSASIDDENANISSDSVSTKVQCTKCNRDCTGTMDLYRHMLDCSSDYAWLLAKKRNHIKYRYFGSRRRRTHRSNSSTIRKIVRPKKERDTSDTASQKSKEPSTPRPRPSDGKCNIL